MGGLGRMLPTVWLSSSFLSAGLSVWEAAFLLDVGEKKKIQISFPRFHSDLELWAASMPTIGSPVDCV